MRDLYTSLDDLVDVEARKVNFPPSLVDAESEDSKRDYSNVKPVVVDHYRNLRSKQTHEHVLKMHRHFKTRERRPLTIWKALEIMATIVDTSDPDISLPNLEHLYQTAEGLREEGAERWLILAGLIHDLGKVMFFWDCEEEGTSIGAQWSVTGDSFITGCAFPTGSKCIFPEFNKLNADYNDSRYNSLNGVYEPNCGLGNTYASWGHDEYLYQVLTENGNDCKHTLPPEALYIIRFHSCYPWHSHGAYTHLENEFDRKMRPIVKSFQKHDLYVCCSMLFYAVPSVLPSWDCSSLSLSLSLSLDLLLSACIL